MEKSYSFSRFSGYLILILLCSLRTFGQTVSLDQADLDYTPGETVYITGVGWYPNEPVVLRIDHLTQPIPDHGLPDPHLPWDVVADSNGNFTTSWYVTEYELGASLALVAQGEESGAVYEVFFTDSGNFSYTTTLGKSNTVNLLPGTSDNSTLSTDVKAPQNNGNISVVLVYKQTGGPTITIGSGVNQINLTSISNSYSTGSPPSGTAQTKTFPVTVSIGSNVVEGTYLFEATAIESGGASINDGQVWDFSVVVGSAGGSGGLTVTAPLCAQGGAFTITYSPSSGQDVTETKTTPFSFTAKKNTNYRITTIDSTVNGNAYTGLDTVSGITPNTNDFTQTVTLAYTDNTAPSISCPANITQSTDAGKCGAVVTYVAPVGTDNCPGQSTVQTAGLASGSEFPKGVTTNTFEVIDSNGNKTSCSFDVIVKDNQNPTIICKSSSPFSRTPNNGNPVCTYKVDGTEFDPESFGDNCPGETISNSINNKSSLANAILPIGLTTIVWTVTDASGNTAYCNTTVNVVSTLAATCKANTLDNTLYFGYSADQSETITVKPTGGTAPYTVSIKMSRPLFCNIITNMGDELWSAPGANSTQGVLVCPTSGLLNQNDLDLLPVSTKTNIDSGGVFAVNVTLMDGADIIAIITDAYGCEYICTTHIDAQDARCFAGKSGVAKVKLCHATGVAKEPCKELCVDESAVAAHLAHGDFLGTCSSDCKPPKPATNTYSRNEIAAEDGFEAMVTPNPSQHLFYLELNGNSNEPVRMDLYDMLGRRVSSYSDLKMNQFTKFGEDLQAGAYIALITQGEFVRTVRLIKK